MKSYNGFTSAQRIKAQAWLNKQWREGEFPRPVECMACGQTAGRIDAHAEDYSEPFKRGKTDQFHLCFRCHMAVHCRFKSPAAWEKYRRDVRAGYQFTPVGDFARFVDETIKGLGKKAAFNSRPAPGRTVLDEIAG